jgi:two-component sensor histidine kinase
LLRLQSQRITDSATRGMFEEARNRVQAIASIHELLYRSPDLARVDFGAYLNRLTRDLFSFFGIPEEQIHLAIHVSNAQLEVSRAIPCGLIVNELVTNALKHAFPNERNGTVKVFLNCVQGTCTLAVEDNGVGLPDGFDWAHPKSLGLQLVRVLTTQLDGVVSIEGHSGTRCEISFPQVTN